MAMPACRVQGARAARNCRLFDVDSTAASGFYIQRHSGGPPMPTRPHVGREPLPGPVPEARTMPCVDKHNMGPQGNNRDRQVRPEMQGWGEGKDGQVGSQICTGQTELERSSRERQTSDEVRGAQSDAQGDAAGPQAINDVRGVKRHRDEVKRIGQKRNRKYEF